MSVILKILVGFNCMKNLQKEKLTAIQKILRDILSKLSGSSAVIQLVINNDVSH